jgi:protein-L-isoaspartate(D-aspartate) O-methyltransferase
MMKERLISYWKEYSIINDEHLIEAFKSVPREKFVLEHFINEAYGDYPLPILSGQTISQPTTIMVMTQALELKPEEKVLEVGAGSGYQAALIARMIGSLGKVITTEVIPELAEFAKKNLKKAGIKNVEVMHYDGSQGYKKEAPFHKIIVTAACPKIPEPLVEQLKINGILVAPVGSVYSQEMLKVKKLKNGKLDIQNLGEFVFVPLVGKYGYK